MTKVLALVRAGWLTASSYRLSLLLSVGSLLLMVVPLYFVAGALQPVMADSIASQGGEYFAFLVLGMMVLTLLTTAVTALPGAVGSSIANGTLEAMLTTRVRLPELLVGMMGYPLIWTGVRAGLLLAAGLALGVHLAWERSLAGLLILGLIVLAHIPFGLIAASGVLAFRTTGSIPQAVLALSGLLGGVYYPTHVIPSWLESVSGAIPLTYGLRALRRTMLEGESLAGVLPDLAVLCGLAALLYALSLWLLHRALRYSRRVGSLALY
ncbi:MAG: ABC transporter permease [Gemmatimonadales bacterium]|nr:ABC transporter permease [Gemmatimonadales bacterium]